MKNTLIPLFCLMMLLTSASSKENLPKAFTDLISQTKMEFTLPTGMIPTAVVANDQMNYDFAIKHPDKNFEVRYTIHPLKARIKEYNKKVKNMKPGDIHVDPNRIYKTSFKAINYNISGGKQTGGREFSTTSIQNDFKAEWGMTTLVEVPTAFGQGYKYCMTIAIHKDDFADAYIFFLTDDKDKLMELALPAFYSLKFK